MNLRSADRRVILLLLLWWIVNVIQAAFTGLSNDEAYYWMFAQSLDWGYFDHPPMTGLLVWLGNFIGGELGIRLFTTMLQPIYLYILWYIIRPERATVKDASLFVTICAAMPILQLYGFVAVPDAPLMMFSALFLLSYKRFCERESWQNMVFMAVSMALLAYSKYHGALVVFFTLASNPKILLNKKLYLSGAITLLLYTPHLLWQYNHDWVSFDYHLSSRNREFSWSYITEFWLNLFAVFNPFFFPLFFKGMRRDGRHATEKVRHALYTIVVGFVLFFTISSLRGYVQPQWVIVIAFGLIMILFGYVRQSERLTRYTMRVGVITIALIGLLRIEMITNIFGIKYEIFKNEESYGQIAEVANGRPIIFRGSYAIGAKYNYYTGGEAYSQPAISYRSSQWQFMDNDTAMAGRAVIAEATKQEAEHTIQLANGRTFNWVEIEDFRPARKVVTEVISGEIYDKMKSGDVVNLKIKITNPYDYPISLNSESFMFAWVLPGRSTTEIPLDIDLTLPARGALETPITLSVPELENGEYKAGFTIKVEGIRSWYSGEKYSIKINNN